MTNNPTVEAEDLIAVRSRVSWGAILGGAVVALSLYFLLTVLATAVGMSINDRTSAQTLSTAAAVWAIAITVICLFFGGMVAAHLTTGENKVEAALYGIMVWAVVFAILVWLMATGVRAGFGAMVGVAHAGSMVNHNSDWEASARNMGITQAQIDEAKARAQNSAATAQDPAARDAAGRKIAWWTFFGTWLAMAAAALGGYAGAGPTFRLVTAQRVNRV